MKLLSTLDLVGLAVWALLWAGYTAYAARACVTRPCMMGSTARYRRAWMREAYWRDNRVADVALMGNLMHSATFFSSTTLLVVGALFAFLGTIERGPDVVEAMSKLPFAARTSQSLLELKAFSLTLVFVYALLRFTWSLRQFNLVNIVLGAYPARKEDHLPDDRMIDQAARLNELAGVNFAQGLRAYYYSVPLLAWLINPWLLIAGAIVITLATWYMEFRSATVRALAGH